MVLQVLWEREVESFHGGEALSHLMVRSKDSGKPNGGEASGGQSKNTV